MRFRALAGGVGVVLALACTIPSAALAGDGTFPDALATTITGLAEPASLAVGDFNNDGRQDLVVVERDDNRVALLTGLGDGTFAPPARSAVGSEPAGVAVADFDGDGNEDIAAVGGDADLLSILRGNGNGTFQAKVDTPLNADGLAVAVGDFDGNGDPDLVIPQESNSVALRLGAGGATFTSLTTLATGPQPASVAVGDFDGDGDEDFATGDIDAGGAGAEVSARLNNGVGVFGARIVVGIDTGADSIVAADFDSDGDDDLATRRQNGITVVKSNGNGTFNRVDFDAGGRTQGIAVADVNSDDSLDLLTIQVGSKVAVLPGDGSGGFGAPVVQTAPTNNSPIPVIGDFDADGTEDFAYAEVNIEDRLFVRRGAGAPVDSTSLLVNGGGEAATGASAGRLFATQTPAVPGWTSTGPLSHIRYDAAGGFLPRLVAARWGGQEAYFVGGPAASSSASQTVDVSGSSASIDARLATLRLAGYLGGYRTNNDAMTVTATFADGSGQALGVPLQIGPVTAADRHNLSTLLRRTTDAAVPAGTRSVAVTLSAQRTDGAYNDAAADRLGLFLTAPEPPSLTPPGGDGSDSTPPETTITKEPKAKSSKTKAKYKFTSSEPNSTFECAFDSKRFKPCDAGKAKYKKLDFGKHKFAVRATDAAGNTDQTPDKDKFKRKP